MHPRYLISEEIARKLKEKHKVSEAEVIQCFENRSGKFAYDTREDHQTNPPTLWFISETHAERVLKVVFLIYSNTEYVIKTAYEPNDHEKRLYASYKSIE